jgi:hypothetical protein
MLVTSFILSDCSICDRFLTFNILLYITVLNVSFLEYKVAPKIIHTPEGEGEGEDNGHK